MNKATELIDDLRAQGYSDNQIQDALCDGEYLATIPEYTQDDIEEAYYIVSQRA